MICSRLRCGFWLWLRFAFGWLICDERSCREYGSTYSVFCCSWQCLEYGLEWRFSF